MRYEKGQDLADLKRSQQAVAQIIEAIGEDPRREGLRDTPRRVAEMYADLLSGIGVDPRRELEVGFEEGHHEMVIIKGIPFYSLCEHHFLPFYGVAHIGYIPSGRVVGISKIARVLDVLARRPQLQERLTAQIADTIADGLKPEGVAVVIEAEHLCMVMRGIKKPGSSIVTSASRGSFRRGATRSEFLSLIQKRL